jgi:Zn ribbon nucleic-acid-binding protein
MMTVEELKAEAKKLGYRIIPEPERITLMPCPLCGKKRTEEWYEQGGLRFRQCANCGFKGGSGRTAKDAKAKWNDAVRRRENNND